MGFRAVARRTGATWPAYTTSQQNAFMKAYVGVMDGEWYRFLAARPAGGEVNFWRPAGGWGSKYSRGLPAGGSSA